MASAAARFRSVFKSRAFVQFSLTHSSSSKANLEESIRAAVEAKAYQKIPELLNASRDSCRNPNPFTFLSTFSKNQRFSVVDEMLQSFISIRPRSQPRKAYSCLLSLTLESSDRLPLALAIVQRMLRSGCLPAPQTHLMLSKAWLDRRQRLQQPVWRILLEMNSIGYSPDCGTCNYLILSLCKIDHFVEAVEVMRGMGRAGCIPDLDSFGTLIGEMSEFRLVNEVVELVEEMVRVHLLNPRKETIVKAVDAMRANREVRRAVEMIEFLEKEGVSVGFEAYESTLEGFLEVRQFILAGKFVVMMTERGFIPYIRVRQRLFEGLVNIGEAEFASVVRQRFAQLKS
ncbi:Pentatricopeptide repeat superfamily protein [Perilla frutescens var. frutescens]|nr:Pentatricopeptide repeat superfamily protein [Perilla frutescens var. frutescens]